MKKKFVYVLMTLVFALALSGGSMAILSADNLAAEANSSVSRDGEGEQSEVESSADAYGVNYSNGTYIKQTVNGSNQAVYTVSYSGAQQWIDLPAGQYTLQAWGASGGGRDPSTIGSGANDNSYNATYQGYANAYGNTQWNTGGDRGGAGGFVQGVMTLTSLTRLYLRVGGAGTYSGGTATGGWNGGGNSSIASNGSGGGASDIRIGGDSVQHRVLVAGGGGGSDNYTSNRGGADDGSGGAGGGDNGQRYYIDGYLAGSYATQSGGYNFGTGQTPSARTDTGGAGGGWYGGYASNHNNGGAGGGSSYVLTSGSFRPSGYAHGTVSQYNMTGKLSYAGIWKGHGKLAITIMNAPPVTKNVNLGSRVRGAGSAATAPNALANDTDNYRTLTWVDTNKIFYDEACTQAVPSSLLTVSGMAANAAGGMVLTPKQYFAKRTFYVRIKDNFPLTKAIAFEFGAADQDITAKAGVSVYPISGTDYEYRVGNSTTGQFTEAENAGAIYNPEHGAVPKYTVVIPKPIALSANSIYVYAKDLFSDADYPAYDDMVITSVANASTTTYKIDTAAADYVYGRGYSRIRIYSTGVAATSAGYIRTTIDVRSVEKSTSSYIGTARKIELVFKVDNTRPKLLSDPSLPSDVRGSELVVNTYVGAPAIRVDLSQICYDLDRNKNSITAVKVPRSEFIYLDKYGNNLSASLDVTSNYYFTAEQNGATGESLSSTAEGTKALKFETNSIVRSGEDASMAYLSYTIDASGQFLTLNPLRGTRYQYDEAGRKGDFYFMIQVRDDGEAGDSGIWYPVAVKVNNTKPSQPDSVAFASSADTENVITDVNGNKTMYFSPMGLGALDLSGVGDDSKQVRGIAADKDVYNYYVDKASTQNVKSTYVYNEFLLFDKEQFGPNNKIETPFYTIEPVTLYASAYTAAKIAGGKVTLPTGASDLGWNRYDEWGDDIKFNVSDNKVIEFLGIKVTFLRSTQGMYIQQPVVVKDTRGGITDKENGGTLDGLVNLLVKMENNSVIALDNSKVNKNVTGTREYVDPDTSKKVAKIIPAGNDGVSLVESGGRVEISVPNGTAFELTPYDLAGDIDLASGWNRGVNTNPNKSNPVIAEDGKVTYTDDAGFVSQLTETRKDINCFYTADLLNLSTQAGTLKLDELIFDGTPQVYNGNAGGVELNTENNRLTVRTTSRTATGTPMYFTVKISDGKTSYVEIPVYVVVRNNAPITRTNAANVFYLASNFAGLSGDNTNSSNDYSAAGDYTGSDLYNHGYNVREFKPADLAFDYEDTVLSFAGTEIGFYTMTGGALTSFAGGADYVEASFTQASGNRSGQVLKVVAKACTQQIPGGLFIGVRITDGYGSNTDLNTSLIYLQIEVTNDMPQLNKSSDTGFVHETVTGAGGEVIDEYDMWKIAPNNSADIKTTKYIVGNPELYKYLTQTAADKVNANNIRLIGSDNDAGQGLTLYADERETAAAGGVPNVPLYAVGEPASQTADDVAVYFTLPSTDYSSEKGLLHLVQIVYFEDQGDGTFAQLPSPYNDYTTTSTVVSPKQSGEAARPYVDNVNWAIAVNPEASFTNPIEMAVKVRDTADTSRADEIGYNGKDRAEFEINGFTTLNFKVDVGTTGMTVTHNVYRSVNADGSIENRYYYPDGTASGGGANIYTGFRYNGITVPSTSAVRVPMSYFAFPSTLPETAAAMSYAVSYNGVAVDKNGGQDEEIFKRISLTDGVNVWTGATLNNNPFVKFSTLSGTSATDYNDLAYNNSEIRANSTATTVSGVLNENTYGLSIAGKGPRSGSVPLKLTLDLAMYKGWGQTGTTPQIDVDNAGKQIVAKATVDLKVENDNIALEGGRTFSTGSKIPSGNISAYTFKLTDGAIAPSEDILAVSYKDNNKLDAADLPELSAAEQEAYIKKYRDSARFNMASAYVNGAALTTSQIQHMVNDAGDKITSGTTTVQELADYLGVSYATGAGVADIATAIRALTQDDLNARAINAGYSDYFTVDGTQSDGDTFTIRPIKKTTFNYRAAMDASKTVEENLPAVRTAAQAKGLAVDLTADKQNYEIYFPFKILVYDTYAGSGFEDSSWELLTIKVLINNTNPTVNTALYGSGSYYELALSMEDKYTMSLVNVLEDRDMKVSSAGGEHYMTESEINAAGSGVDPDTTDFIDLPAGGVGYKDLVSLTDAKYGIANYDAKRVNNTYVKDAFITENDKVIDVEVSNDKLIFTVNRKVTAKKTFVYVRLSDNTGASVDFKVLVTVENQAPELLKARDNAGNKTNELFYDERATQITMKTGDSFDLVVTPYDMFNPSTETGKFGVRDESSFGPNTTYGNLKNEPAKFSPDSSSVSGKTYMGAFVVAEDDSPETLRFASFNTSSLNNRFTVTEKNTYKFGTSYEPLSFRITANGVCSNMPLKFTVKDDGGKTLSITLVITVQSTPPSVIDDPSKLPFPNEDKNGDPGNFGVSVDDLAAGLVFRVETSVGAAPISVEAKALCSDPDSGDSLNMYIYKAFSGGCFSIGGDESGVNESAYVRLDPKESTSDGKVRLFTITPTNFISDPAKAFEQIVFYVMDPSGQTLNDAQKIIINVYIAPNELSNPGINGDKSERTDFQIKSKAEFENADDNDKTSNLTVVGAGSALRAAGGSIIDKDYGASLTNYTIKVYAMMDVELDELGKVVKTKPLTYTEFMNKNVTAAGTTFTPYEIKRYVEDGGIMVIENADIANNALYEYVMKYFTFNFSLDGSTIEFIPANVTPESEEIPIYVELSKRGISGDTSRYTAGALYQIGVKNSAPTATQNSAENKGYFHPDDPTNKEPFLTFSGTVNSTRVYDLQNASNKAHGLFQDLDDNDQIRYAGKAVGGSSGYEVLESYDYGDGKGVVTTHTGYKADSIRNLGEAITITPMSGNSQISIKFNRKVDASDANGADAIKLPVKVYAQDNSGAISSTVIILEIKNSEPFVKPTDALDNKLPYTLVKDGDDYLLEMSVEQGFDKQIKLEDIWSDPDITAGKKNYDKITFKGTGDEYLSDIDKNASKTHVVKNAAGNELFHITTNASNDYLNVSCKSYSRGETGLAKLIIADSAGAETAIINIRLTVANSQAQPKEVKQRYINILGSQTPDDENNTLKTQYFNILDFVTDPNTKDTEPWTPESDSVTDRSYLRISSVMAGENSQILMHPEIAEGDDTQYNYVISTGIDDSAEIHPQKFFIKPQVGVYGTQSVFITVVDDGNNIDAANKYSKDALSQMVELVIRVVRDTKDMPPAVQQVKQGKMQEINVRTLFDEADKPFSDGYTLDKLVVAENEKRVEAISKTDDNGVVTWFIKGVQFPMDETKPLPEVKAICYFANKDYADLTPADFIEVPFNVQITENKQPVKQSKYAGADAVAIHATPETEKEGIIYFSPEEFFHDEDSEGNLKFIKALSDAESILTVNVDNAINQVLFKFKANRTVTVTLHVTDETGNDYNEKFLVYCPEKADLGLFPSIVLYISQRPTFFIVIAGIVLLLIIILLIIILSIRKKKKMRKEIEALLVSEMELEEQMLKLSASPNPTYYQSYGYLPPTQQIQNNPSFMLGQGTDINTNNAIGLNPGETPPTGTGNTTPNPDRPDNGGFDDENF